MEEVREIINTNQSILTSLTSLTSFYTLACIGQKFSARYSKFLNSLSISYVFRGKRGKEVRINILISVSLAMEEPTRPTRDKGGPWPWNQIGVTSVE